MYLNFAEDSWQLYSLHITPASLALDHAGPEADFVSEVWMQVADLVHTSRLESVRNLYITDRL